MTERLTKREYDGSVGISALRYYNYDDFQKMAKKLAHYEDLEEQGRLVELPAENDFKRDELDRCIHRHCNKCDGYRKEVQRYKDLEEQGRLVVLPEELDFEKLVEALGYNHCPTYYGLKGEKDCDDIIYCKECWGKALKGE